MDRYSNNAFSRKGDVLNAGNMLVITYIVLLEGN
jgi:hypothetical protein